MLRVIIAFFMLTVLVGCSENSEKKNPEKKDLVPKEEEQEIIISNTPYEKAYDKTLKLWHTKINRKLIETSFGKAHVIACGPKNGEVLILLHGMNASSTMWYPNIRALSKKYRVYAIDFLLEPGRSENTGNVESTEQVIDWYFEIFDKLKLKKFSLIGASRGGWLAVNIALRDQERVNKMALLSPAQTLSWIPPGQDFILNLIYTAKPKRENLEKILATLSSNVDNIDSVFVDQYFLATLDSEISKIFVEMTPFKKEKLKSITIPVMVLIGDDDFINKPQSLTNAEKLFPNVETKTIENSGHFLSIDQSATVNQLLLDFLK